MSIRRKVHRWPQNNKNFSLRKIEKQFQLKTFYLGTITITFYALYNYG